MLNNISEQKSHFYPDIYHFGFSTFFLWEKSSPATTRRVFMNAAKGHLWTFSPLILHLRRTEKAKEKKGNIPLSYNLWDDRNCEVNWSLYYTCPVLHCCCHYCCYATGREITSKLINVAAAMIEFEKFRHCSSAAKWDQPKPIKRFPSSALDNVAFMDVWSPSYCKSFPIIKSIHERWNSVNYISFFPSGRSFYPATTV